MEHKVIKRMRQLCRQLDAIEAIICVIQQEETNSAKRLKEYQYMKKKTEQCILAVSKMDEPIIHTK